MRAFTRSAAAVVSRHWLITAAVAVAVALRMLFVAAYVRPFIVVPDSVNYLDSAATWVPHNFRPFGYSAFLSVLAPLGDLRVVPLVQHLAGPALGVAIYAFLVRRGVRKWLAVLAAAPMLFDQMSVSMEHFVMADTLFLTLLTAAMLLLLRETAPSAGVMAVCGLLLALAGLTRTVGLPLGALALGYLLIRKAGPRACAAFAIAFVVPVAGYMVWFQSQHGVFGVAEQPELPMLGRVSQIVECDRLELTPQEREFCPPEPLPERHAPDWYWLGRETHPPNPAISSFNAKVIREQPLDLIRRWAVDTSYFFRYDLPGEREECLYNVWVPQRRFPPGCYPPQLLDKSFRPWANGDPGMLVVPETARANVVRIYLTQARTPPPVLWLVLVVVIAGAFRWRARRMPRLNGADGRDALMATVTGLALMGLAVAGAMFDLRYLLPALPLLGIGAALSANLLLDKRNQPVTEPDASPAAPLPVS